MLTKEEKAQINREKVRAYRLKNKKICPSCNERKIDARSKFCRFCIKTEREWKQLTVQEAIYEKHHKSSAFALIRYRARAVVKKAGIPQHCTKCGYDKHVEVCHIKAINEFELTESVDVVNDIANLIVLCPNCHWEFDNLSRDNFLSETVES